MSIALIPGSFDPMTVGHVDVIRRASRIFDTVIVALMINADKKYLFTKEERVEIAKRSLSDVDNVTVVFSDGWLYKLFREINADVIVKGIRNESDLAYENKMAEFNLSMEPKAQTVYIPAADGLTDVSSTAFREAYVSGSEFERFLTRDALEYVLSLNNKK